MFCQKLFVSAVALVTVVSASTQYCGLNSNTICANVTAATAPCYFVDVNGSGEHECNTVVYNGYANVTNWSQCKDVCNSTKDCESFSYSLVPPSSFTPTSTTCQLYFHDVDRYTEACNSSSSTSASLVTYYDKNCSAPPMFTSGEVPATPNNSTVNGTCDGALAWNGDQYQWAADGFKAAPAGLSQTECHKECDREEACKAIYWNNGLSATAQFRYSGQTYYYPPGKNGFTPTQCVLLSQPVSKIVTSTVDFDENNFFDKNCARVAGA